MRIAVDQHMAAMFFGTQFPVFGGFSYMVMDGHTNSPSYRDTRTHLLSKMKVCQSLNSDGPILLSSPPN